MLDNERFGKRLVKAGVITQDQLDEALHHQELQEGRLGEILVRLGYVSESTILQFLAAEFRTRYVSTERLARARIPQQVLDLLPVHLAERYNLIPVLYDAETSTLSIVTSEPQNEENLREVHMLTSVRELRVYVALQPAVQAAIRKHYRGEINAFKDLLYQNASPLPNLNSELYGSGGVGGSSSPDAYGGYGPETSYPLQHGIPDPNAPYYPSPGMYTDNPYDPAHGHMYDPNAVPPYQYSTYDPSPYDYSDYNPNYADLATAYPESTAYPQDDFDNEVTRLHVPHIGTYEPDTSYPDSGMSPDYGSAIPGNVESMGTPSESKTAVPASQLNAVALARLLMSKIERGHSRYQRHHERQRPLLQAIMRRLEFSHKESQPIWLAFYLHHMDLPEPHPTLLTMAQDPALAEKQKVAHRSFSQRLSHLRLPEETTEVLEHIYERADGSGFPDNYLREEIPLGSRLLAILDAFEDLQYSHSSKPSLELVQMMRKEQGTLFDSRLLDIFEEELERVEQYQRGAIPLILLLDPDFEVAQELERVLWDRGMWVFIASHPSEAEEIAIREKLDLIVLEVALQRDRDGFSFVEQLRSNLSHIPEFVFLTNRDNQEDLDRGMELARDYMIKPLNSNVIATKLHKQLQQITKEKSRQKKTKDPHQLAGSLEQLGLAELIQFLSQGRRSGRLTIESGNDTGQIFFDQGEVINATVQDLKGEPALFKMVAWEKGTFSLDPAVFSEERMIQKRTDGLLLDMLRILDESRRDGIDPFAEDGDDDGEGDSESSFFDLSSFDEDKQSAEPKNSSKSSSPPKKTSSGGTPVLFGDLQEDDLDDVFSSSFKEASRDNLAIGKKPN